MTLAIAYSRALQGIDAPLVTVETHLTNGLPAFNIVGLPETAVRESKERVRSAILNSAYEFPTRRITINLAPADLPKSGTRFDISIALGILAASGQIPLAALAGIESCAELALGGEVRPVRGALPAALAARRDGRALLVAAGDADEAVLAHDSAVYCARTLREVCAHLGGSARLALHPRAAAAGSAPGAAPDLRDVQGQFQAKRALEIAAAGGHNLLMFGPPGTGKTMLALRLPGLLPPLGETQALESAAVRSVSKQPFTVAEWAQPPFRAPHHTCSAAALVGGGTLPSPGEVSLAHHGVLFLDELPEFDRRALEALREPLETGQVTISRATRFARYPARTQLIAAMNPCECGYDGDAKVACRCSPERIARYRARISGPLAERIDIHVAVPRQQIDLLDTTSISAESSALVAARVACGREIQLARQGTLNSMLDAAGLRRFCMPSSDAYKLLRNAAERLALSARSHDKVLKLARTIADLAGADIIDTGHVAEATGYRMMDRGRRSP